MTHTVALVDDDREILNAVAEALEAEGFDVLTYSDGEKALQDLMGQAADIAVLDIKMPRMDGMELLGRLRKDTAIPVMFLTSKDSEVDEVLGLRMGADDYLTKPVSTRLLAERIRALLRRKELVHGNNGGTEPPIERGELHVDPSRHECSWKGQQLKLTVTEFLLLKCLVMRPGLIKSRNQLRDAAYGGERIYVGDRTIDSHMKRLRAKFRAVDPDFSLIETHYGVGYRYRGA